MKKFLQKLAAYSWGVLLFALMFTASGVCLISFPEEALPTVVLVISIIAIVFAVALAILALAGKSRDVGFYFQLCGAICALFCGIFLLLKHNDGVALLTLFVGVLVMIDGSFKLHTAILSKRYRHSLWWVMLVLSVVCIAGGLYLVKWVPTDRVKFCSVLMGIVMILEGVQNFLSTFYTPGIDKRRKKEILEESLAETAAGRDEQAGKALPIESVRTEEPAIAPSEEEPALPQAESVAETVSLEGGASVTMQDAPDDSAEEEEKK